jgi:hypothetical protein
MQHIADSACSAAVAEQSRRMDHPSSHTSRLQQATSSLVSVFHDALKAEMLTAASALAGIEVIDVFTADPDGYQPVLHTWNDRVLDLDDFFPNSNDLPDAQHIYNQACFIADAAYTLDQLSSTLRALEPSAPVLLDSVSY